MGTGWGAAGAWGRPCGQHSLCLVFGDGDRSVLSSSSLAGVFL